MAPKSKAQLEAQVKELKAEIRELRSSQKTDEFPELPERGFVVSRIKGDFIKFDVEFDPESKLAQITGEENLGKGVDLAIYKLKKSLVLRMVKLP